MWPELLPVIKRYYAKVPKVHDHLASGTPEVEAMKEWLFTMDADSRSYSFPTGVMDGMTLVYYGTYNVGM